MAKKTETRKPAAQQITEDFEYSAEYVRLPSVREGSGGGVDQNGFYSVLARAHTAVQRLTWKVAQEDPVGFAAVASRDSDVDLMEQLVELGAQLEHPGDPLAAARARGAKARGDLLAEAGGALAVDQVAERLEMTPQGVNVRGRKGQLVRLPRGKSFVYPAAQFSEDGGTVAGLEETLRALGSSGWGALRFLMQGNARLGGKAPLEVLRRGGAVERVVAAAQAYGETGGAP